MSKSNEEIISNFRDEEFRELVEKMGKKVKKSKEEMINNPSKILKSIEGDPKDLEIPPEIQEESKNTKLPPDIQNKIIDECLKENQINNIPPKLFKRNQYGLLENYNYIFNEDGSINWKKMVPAQFLYLNSDTNKRANIEKKYGKKYEEIDLAVDEIDDCDLIITLAGVRYLAKLKGYYSVEITIKEANENYAAVACKINFYKNYESLSDFIFSDSACAHPNNTSGFGRNYLLELATNRAFCRTVRAALNLSIVSREELGGKTDVQEQEPSQDDLPYQILEKLMKEKGLNFDRIKKKCVLENVTGAENFNSIKDIPKATVSNLIGKLNKYKPE